MKLSVKAWLSKSRLTQADLARLLDVSHPSVHRYVNGRRPWPLREAAALVYLSDGAIGLQDLARSGSGRKMGSIQDGPRTPAGPPSSRSARTNSRTLAKSTTRPAHKSRKASRTSRTARP